MKRREISFNKPKFDDSELKYVKQAFEQGFLAGNGHFTAYCQSILMELTGAQKVQLVHSCTAALEMAAILCDLGPGDEVIMPSFTFVSTANAVVLRGATPVFVDVLPQTLNIDPKAVVQAVTSRTKAIFAVHYAGVPAEMDALSEISKDNNLILVEDAAQALGSKYNERPAGSLGDLAAFSFHATKNVTSGEGGALAINRADLLERADIVRDKGTNRARFLMGQVDKYSWVDIGSSYSPSEISAAILAAQLEKVVEINADRLLTVSRYKSAFDFLVRSERIGTPITPHYCKTNGHLFYLMMRDARDRKQFIDHMWSCGIETPFHYIPLHSSAAGVQFGRTFGKLETTDQASARLVRLPLYFEMGDEVNTVVSAAMDYFIRKVP